MTISDWIQLGLLLIAICGVVLAIKEWQLSNNQLNHSNVLKRAEFVNQIIEKLRFDKTMADTLALFDYGHRWYGQDFHNGKTGHEAEIDQLLSFLSYLCYLKDEKILTDNEFSFLQYELNRVCNHADTKEYLWNLFNFSRHISASCSFEKLINYAEKNGFLPDGFKAEKTDKKYSKLGYRKFLNF